MEIFLFFMIERWRVVLDDNKVIGVIFIDYKEVFDVVLYEFFLYKF